MLFRSTGQSPVTKENDGRPGSSTLTGPMFEVDNTERQIFELPGDFPTLQEADSRQLSEKESMMVRERIYNGVDPNGSAPVSPISAVSREQPRRLAPVTPLEVAIVGGRLPHNVSPTTPRPARDGASLAANDTFFQSPTRVPRDGRYLETEDTLLTPISPLEDISRRRFSYES